MRTPIHRRVLGTLIALPFVAAACGDDNTPDDTPIIQAALDGLAQSEISDNGFLGMGISVELADGRLFRADAGWSDPDHGAAYDDAATEQVIGSVTKLFTAVVTMQLVESGDIALDDTLDRWFTFPGAEAMTVRMLMKHTTGLADDLDGMTIADISHPWTPEQLLDRALAAPRYGAPPLAQAVYTNTTFILLGLIIEAETGESWEQNVHDRIAQPLGLHHTYYAGESDKADDLAGGWLLTDGGWLDSLSVMDPSLGWAVGGLVTTNDELMRFTRAFFAGELFTKPATLQQMLAFDTVMDPAYIGQEPPSTVGLTVLRFELDGVRLDGHLGHTYGFNAVAARDPDTGAIIVVTSNDDRNYVGNTALKAAKFVRAL